MRKTIFLLSIFVSSFTFSQIGIGTNSPDPSAALDISSNSSGILLPRLMKSERDNIEDPAQGLMIYCTDCGSRGQLQLFDGTGWFGIKLTESESNDMDGDGYPNYADCDDNDPNINPGADETCNGIDDNCDGSIDNFETNQSCTAGVGGCQTTGTLVCEDGQLECDAVPNNPVAEICSNGIDDDCDGIADSSYTTSITLDAVDSESVKSDNFDNYNDNVLRALFVDASENNGVEFESNGFIKFDLSSLPDNAEINSISLTLIFESKIRTPNLDIYYCETDGWSRGNTPENGIPLTSLLNTNNNSFGAINTYQLDLLAFDIYSDLSDNVLTIGLKNPKTSLGGIYFFGSDNSETRPTLDVSYNICD